MTGAKNAKSRWKNMLRNGTACVKAKGKDERAVSTELEMWPGCDMENGRK